MAPWQHLQQQKTGTVNASSMKDQKYVTKLLEVQDDVASSGTASTTEESPDADLDQDCSPSGLHHSDPGTPANVPPKTSLRSLASKASLFVPQDLPMMLPPCLRSPGKGCLASVIQTALGNDLWNFNMMDYQSFAGAWHTAVEITIPALSASMCHLVASHDTEAIESAQKMTQSQAVQSLTHAIEDHQAMSLSTDPAAQLCVEFSVVEKDKMCRQFTKFGKCSQGDSCQWAHAVVEVFMINFILAPLALVECAIDSEAPQAATCEPMPVGEVQRMCHVEREPMPVGQVHRGAMPVDKVLHNATVQCGLMPVGLVQREPLGYVLQTYSQWAPRRLPIPPPPPSPPPEDIILAIPSLPPIPPPPEQDLACLPLAKYLPETTNIQPPTPEKRLKNPRLVSKKSWADMGDDSDADES